MTNKLIILAGGISSRMKNSVSESLNEEEVKQANQLPKGMIGVGKNNRPFLDYLLYNAYQSGFSEVAIVVNDRDPAIREYYEPLSGTERLWNLKLRFPIQKIPEGNLKPLGTADALQQALEQLPEWSQETFIICNSDNLYSVNAFKILIDDAHSNALPGYERSSLEFEEARIRQFALIATNEENFLTDIIEKPTPGEEEKILQFGKQLLVSMNIFKFSYQAIFPYLKKTPLNPVRKEKELPTALLMLAHEQAESVYVIPVADTVPDLTSKNDIQIVRKFLESHFPGL